MAPLSAPDVEERLRSLAGWSRSGDSIQKKYSFPDFKGSMEFVNRVAGLAESMDHHPDIFVSYDTVTLTLTSHDSGGLTDRDFRLAAKIDA